MGAAFARGDCRRPKAGDALLRPDEQYTGLEHGPAIHLCTFVRLHYLHGGASSFATRSCYPRQVVVFNRRPLRSICH